MVWGWLMDKLFVILGVILDIIILIIFGWIWLSNVLSIVFLWKLFCKKDIFVIDFIGKRLYVIICLFLLIILVVNCDYLLGVVLRLIIVILVFSSLFLFWIFFILKIVCEW